MELSIVLVILGLLTGGILTGQSLIRASELRAVTSEFQRYQAAVQTFHDKYFAVPGDMRNAVRFWGAQTGAITDGVDATCAALTTPSTTATTCNGDGNGIINNVVATSPERTRFWQHLANAGLIEGTYSGVHGATPAYAAGVNVPKSKLGNALWVAYHYTDLATNGYAASGNKSFFIGGPTAGTIGGSAAVMKPEEAWNIDTKMDDGRPAYGFVLTPNTQLTPTSTCVTSDTASAANYNLTLSTTACNISFSY